MPQTSVSITRYRYGRAAFSGDLVATAAQQVFALETPDGAAADAISALDLNDASPLTPARASNLLMEIAVTPTALSAAVTPASTITVSLLDLQDSLLREFSAPIRTARSTVFQVHAMSDFIVNGAAVKRKLWVTITTPISGTPGSENRLRVSVQMVGIQRMVARVE